MGVGHERIATMSPPKRSTAGRRLLGATHLFVSRTSSLRDARERLLFLLPFTGLVGLALGVLLLAGAALSPPMALAGEPAASDPAALPASTDDDVLIIRTYTGVMTSTYRISPKLFHGDMETYALANLSQAVDNGHPDYTLVQVVARSELVTADPFPVDPDGLPAEAVAYLNEQPGWIQSKDAAIVAQADGLVAGAARQDVAVKQILAWVRAHTRLVPTCTANDALSVLDSGEATFAGFATLSCALLRAEGIPARYVSGVVLPGDLLEWDWGDRTSIWHAWVEVYYPSLGWVASDPQATINWVDSAHIRSGFTDADQRTVERVGHSLSMSYLQDEHTAHTVAHDARLLWAANTAGEVVYPLQTDLAGTYHVTREAPTLAVEGFVSNARACGDGWELESEAPWLGFAPSTGVGATDVTMHLDATSLAAGSHTAQVRLVGLPDEGCQPPAQTLTHTFTIELCIVEPPRSYLPAVRR